MPFSLELFYPPSRLVGQQSDAASKIYAESARSVFLIAVKSSEGEVVSQGTGFLVAGGKIVTNNHVVRGGKVFIDLGSLRLPATVERADEFNDLAILKVGAEVSAKPLVLAGAIPSPGTNVHAIGNPVGLQKSISSGVVSGVREFDGRKLLQITTPMSHGSSGGPILNNRGEVVGVAVGILEKGQNLNFAVPATLVTRLLKEEAAPSGDVLSLIEKAEALARKREQYEFSTDADSDWQRIDRQVDEFLQGALERAGSDYDLLIKIAEKAEAQNNAILTAAAERAVRARPTAEANFLLSKALTSQARWVDNAEKQQSLRDNAEKAMRAAFRASKQPTAAMYYHFADLLEDRGSYSESDATFRRALELSKAVKDIGLQANSIRGLIRTAHAQGKYADSDSWFKSLGDLGRVAAWDWQAHARRLVLRQQYKEAANGYQQAALLGGDWTNWCEAKLWFSVVSDYDSSLACARKCVEFGSSKKGSEERVGAAHAAIANILNDRGVYEEALSHAREAVAMQPSDAWSYLALADAQFGLRRFQETINAAKQAIRLSDGKIPSMHFRLAAAYFETENWEFARQSFEMAAKLEPKDSAAPYNVALCLARLGYRADAARWYEEVLRRNPNHPERQQILRTIQILRP